VNGRYLRFTTAGLSTPHTPTLFLDTDTHTIWRFHRDCPPRCGASTNVSTRNIACRARRAHNDYRSPSRAGLRNLPLLSYRIHTHHTAVFYFIALPKRGMRPRKTQHAASPRHLSRFPCTAPFRLPLPPLRAARRRPVPRARLHSGRPCTSLFVCLSGTAFIRYQRRWAWTKRAKRCKTANR